jgi:hypothetical protein
MRGRVPHGPYGRAPLVRFTALEALRRALDIEATRSRKHVLELVTPSPVKQGLL